MKSLWLDINNFLRRRVISKISKSETYKLAVAQFYKGKSLRNSDLGQAAEMFEEAHNEVVLGGNLVTDLKILHRSGLVSQVQTPNGDIYEAQNLATNSYNDLDVETSCREELARYVLTEDLSSCLSRKAAGQTPIHLKLQDEIANFLGYETSLLATSGYIAQQAALFSLFSKGDVIFSDEHNHASLVDGMRLSQAKVIVYPHLDYEKLEELMAKHRGSYNCAGIVSDGVFSAHGTLADLTRIDRLKRKFNAISIIDDTHGFTTVGSQGRGIIDYFPEKPDVLTASLAKGLAGFGGVIAANQALIRVIDCLGRQNINTSHLSPLTAAQSWVNLRFYRQHRDRLRSQLENKITFFNTELAKHGIEQYQIDLNYTHPIFSYYGEREDEVIEAFKKLLQMGVMGAFFPPPISPKPTIRFSLHRIVDESKLAELAAKLAELNLKPLSRKYWPQMAKLTLLDNSLGRRSLILLRQEPTQGHRGYAQIRSNQVLGNS